MRYASGFVLVLALGLTASARGQKFFPDDPLRRDADDLPAAKPKDRDLSQLFDFVAQTFVIRPPRAVPEAANVNTLGEVPDSSWFTNRIGKSPMSLRELVAGPNQLSGPDASHPWTVVTAKIEGITPGFTMRDGAGEIFFVKLDPPSSPNLASAAEVISTKFVHAMGYHVPETYVVYFKPDALEVQPGVFIVDEFGKKREMNRTDLAALLKRAPATPSGAIRAVASRKLPGDPLGPFEYWGTREDDPNDVVPHEDRRELRGLRVFAAWLNHDDSRAINTFDTYVGMSGRGHVRHHLLDFASTLGSGSVGPQDPRAGNEYVVDRDPSLRAALSFGAIDRPWRKVRYPDLPEVGRFESSFFDPDEWRPEYPNPAFDRMDTRDAFWAARILSRFTEEAVRAIVHTGEYSDPAAEAYVADTLLARRAKLLKAYFSRVNPIAEFRIADGALEFENLGETAGVATADGYEAEWFRFDNDRDSREPIGGSQKLSSPRAHLPADAAAFFVVRLRTLSAAAPAWKKWTDVYVRTAPDMRIVGIEREP